MRRSLVLVSLYLAAIVGANLLTARFGPGMSVFNAFAFIGLDLTSRDQLHAAWSRSALVWKMGLLIAAGSFLSWLLNRGAGHIALASMLAFGLSAMVDTLVYHLLRRRAYMVKVNGSNLVSGLIDSLVFPTVAFGSFLPWIVLGQFAAKVAGGLGWAFLLRHRKRDTITSG